MPSFGRNQSSWSLDAYGRCSITRRCNKRDGAVAKILLTILVHCEIAEKGPLSASRTLAQSRRGPVGRWSRPSTLSTGR
jgi:hypothetical protein